MRTLALLVISLSVTAILSTTATAQDHPVQAGPVASTELHAELAQLDQQLFKAAFTDCRADQLSPLIAADFEFYHDKSGLIAESGQQFIDSVASGCAARETGENIQASRELTEDSMRVYPLNNYGAIQTGHHRFYGFKEDGTKVLRETAQFTHVWQQTDGKWQLTRVLSYDHQPADNQ